MRRSLRATVVALGVLIACDEPVEPPTTGRMAIRVVVPEVEVPPPTGAPVEGDAPANRVDQSRPQEAAGQDERVGGQVTGVVAQVQPNFNVLGHLTHGRVKISGPTPVDDGPFTLPAGGISKTYEDLAAGGGYTVELFGLVNDSVDYYARTEGVTVPAGGTATPTLTFQSFRPTLSVGPTPTTGFKVTATIGTVPNATGYVVEWAKSSSFSGKTAAAAVGTSHPITVSDTGTYYTRVLAQATGVTTPRSSDVATFEIRTDITASGDSASTAPDPSTSLGRSGTGAFSGTLGALNIFPASDVDWFKIAACTLDTLRLETRAQRAPISSALNTVLRVYDSDGTTQIAANDNLHADTTDSRLLVAVPYQDTFRIQVSGTGGTTGEYQLVIDLREGPDNTGTACVPRADLSKSTVGVSSALIAAGATSTITLTARDAADNQIPFGGSTVTFSASGGTSTGSIGAVTDNNDGTYTATFTGETAGTATQISAAIDGSAVTTLPKPTITVNNGPAATVAYRVAPAGATAGDTLRPNIEVIVQDAYGNQVTGATGSVTLAIGTNPAGGTLFGTVTKTLVAGVATFSNLRVDKAGTGYTLVASSGSLVSSTSGGFDITPAEATRLSFVVQPAAGVAGTPLTAVMVAVQDALGNTATGNANSITLNLANNPASANLTGTVTRNAQSGVATFDDLTLDKEGSGFTFQATALLLTGATSNAFSVGLGGATRLVITAEPGNAVAGQSIALQVALKDGAGNTVTTATDSVSIAIGTGALDPSGGAATLGGVRKVEPVSGVATFANLSLDKAFAAYRLVVTAGTLTPDTTVAITITPAGAAQLAFSQQPSSAAVGENITPAPAVQILDQYGNLTTSTAAVNVAIGTNPAGGALFGNTTVLAAGGVATFDTLSIDNAGSGYTLTASSGSLTGVTSAAFNITSGNATKLGFTAQPGNTALGTVMPAFTVAVQDPLGNTIAGATDQVTLTLQANPTGANILSGAVVNAVDGVATFNAVTLDRVGTGYTFKAKATGLDSTISNPFNITVGAPAKLSFTVEPSNATAGGSIAPALKVAVQDVGGNLVTSATNSITLAILNDPSTGTATLGGTVAQPAVGGIATFANITVNKAFNGYTVRATATGLAPDTSAAFNIGAAAANKLAFVTQPTAVAAGDAINPAPQVAVRDAFDNLVPGASNAVSMAIGTNPSGGVLFGTTNAAASGGTATFNDLRLDKAGAGYTLSASATGLTGATSSGFNVTAGNTVSATLSTAIASPATNVVANDFDLSVITVTVRDVNGNPMSGQTVALAATGSNNTVTQPGAVTDGSGQASGTIASTTAETKTVTVTVNPAGTAVVLTQQPTVQFIADVNTISASLSTATANPADPDSVAADNFQQSAVTVVVRDANSNPVAGQAVELATDLSGVLAQPGATDATGTAVGYLRNDVAETNTLSVTVNPAGTPVVLNQQPMVKFWEPACGIPDAVNSTVGVDLANVPANGVDVATVTVTVLDCGSSPVQDATVQVAVSGGGNTVTGPLTTTDVNGVTTATVSSTLAGAKTVIVTVNPGPNQIVLQSQPTVTFDAGAATHVVFVTQPSSTGAGASISPAMVVQIRDAQENVVDVSDNVTLAVSNDPTGTGVVPGGTATRAAVNGVATFDDISIDSVGTGWTLEASSGALTTDISSAFNIVPGPAATLEFVQQPTNITAGASFTPSPTALLRDAFGNVATNATNGVTISIQDNAGAGSLLGTVFRTPTAGLVTFSGLSLDKAGLGYTLAVTATGVTGATSNVFTVSAGVAARLGFSVEPTATVAGVAIAPAIEVDVQDAFGNTVSGATDDILIELATDPSGAATLGGDVNNAAAGGVAEFNDLSLDKAVAGYRLRATSGSLTPDTSVAFTITAAAADRLAFVVEPSTSIAGVSISPAPQVAIVDEFGNTTASTANVTLAIQDDPVGGTGLFGTATVAAVAGVATFNAVNIRAAATGFTLQATSGVLTPITSASFTVVHGAPAGLAFVQQPTNIVAGAGITPSPTVAVRDAFGNAVPTATNNITVAIGTNPGGGSLLGTATRAAVSGTGTFPGLSVNKSGVGYTLVASGTGLTNGTSAAFNVTAGTPTMLGYTVQPANTTAGVAFPSAVQVAIQDNLGNTVTTATDSVFVAIANDANPPTTLSGTKRVAAAAGLATFPGLALNRTGTGFTLGATSAGGYTAATSAPFNVSAEDATKLAFLVQPSGAAAGVALAPSVTVEAQDALGNRVTTFTDSITVAIGTNAGGSTLSGTTQVFAVAGVATFSSLSLNKAGTGYTLTANKSGLSGTVSTAFNIVHGSAAKLGFVVQPSTTAAGNSIAPAPQVAVQDDFGNTVLTATNVVTVALEDNPGGASLFGALSQPAVSGVATFGNLSLDKAGIGYTLAATATDLTGTLSAAFDVGAGAISAANSSVEVSATSVVGDGVQTATITVTVRDGDNNPVPDRTVELSATGGGNTIEQPAAVTDANGVATGTIASTVAEDKTITATVDPAGAAIAIIQQPVVTFTGDPGTISATKSVVDASPTTRTANGADLVNITVTVVDADSAVVPDQTVAFSLTGTGTVINNPAAVTDANGVATGSVAATKAELKTLTVTVNPGPDQRVLATQPELTFVPGPADRVAFVQQPTDIQAGVNLSPAVQVAIQDAQGNTIPAEDGVTVDVAIQGGTGTAGAALLGNTSENTSLGIATFPSLTVDSAGVGYQLVASSGALTTATSDAFIVTAGEANSVRLIPNSAILSGVGSSTTPFAVEARDQFGNLISSPSVNWNSLNQGLATVDGGGVATAAGAGQAVIQAEVDGAAGFALVTVQIQGVDQANLFADAGSGTTEDFRGIWGTSSTDIFAVGTNGTILHYDGISWASQPSGAGGVTLRGVWGSGSNNVVAVGDGGVVVRYDGFSWSSESGVTGENLFGVWGSSPHDIYAVGGGGTVIHYDGGSWSVDTTGLAAGAQLRAVWGTSASDVFIATNQGGGVGSPMVHFDGASWTEQDNPVNEAMVDLWGVAPDTVYAVGDDGFVLKYDGTNWTLTTTLPVGGAFLVGVWGTASDDIYVLSQDNRMFHYDGVSWTEPPVVGSPTLFDLWGTSGSNSVYAAGGGGLIGHGYRGATVQLAPFDTLIAGDTLTLTVQALDALASPIPGVALTWQTSADFVIDVDANGKVTATATSDNDAGIWATATGGASDTTEFWIRVPKVVVITPDADTTFTLNDTGQFTAVVYDWSDVPMDGIPVTWTGLDDPVATVDADGLATSQERGRARVVATAGMLADTARFVVGIRMAYITDNLIGGTGPVPQQLFAQPDTLTSDLPGNLDTLTFGQLNALSPADLRANYDVLAVGWYIDPALDADWATRIEPYLQLGGGVYWEDPLNVGDLAPSIIGETFDTGGPWTLHAVPLLTDGITPEFFNMHTRFTGWDARLAPVLTSRGSEVDGLYGKVGAGCIYLTGPDHLYHGNKTLSGTYINDYSLALNAVKWLTRCPLNDPPGAPESVIMYGNQTITAGVDSTLQLYAVARDAVGTPIPGATITWTSTNEGAATVDVNGLVTAVDNGSAVITAMGSGEASLDVTVDIPADSIAVSPTSAAIAVGGGTSFTHQVFDVGGQPITRPVTWSSLNGEVATAGPSTGDASGVNNGQVTIQALADAVAGYALLSVAAGTPGTRVNAWDSTNAGVGLYGVWGVSPTSVYGGTGSGQVMRYNGSSWSPLGSTGVANLLYSVWGTSDNDVWAVGNSGTIIHWDGGSWRIDTPPSPYETTRFWRVWGTAPNDVYAVGDNGAFLRYDGASWSVINTGVTGILFGLWGTGPDNIFIGGGSGTLMQYDGTNLTPVSYPSYGGEYVEWYGIGGTGPNDIHVTGYRGNNDASPTLHFNGVSWDSLPNPSTSWVFSVLAVAPDEAYGVGSGSNLLQWDGVSWTRMATKNFSTGWGIWGMQSAPLFGGGQSGSVMRSVRGATVASVGVSPLNVTRTVPTTANFSATPRDGSGNPVSYEPAATWLSLNPNVATIDASSGLTTPVRDGQGILSATVGGLSGYGMMSSLASAPTAVNVWDSAGSPTTAWLWTTWGSRSDNIYGVGSGDNIYKYNGSSWSSSATMSPNPGEIRGIWGAAEDDIWAVGGGGSIFHYNGSTWSNDPASGVATFQTLMGVWGSSPKDVWAVGFGGVFLHYDGTSWSNFSAPDAAGVNMWGGIWGASRDTIFAAGDGGRILRYNGTTWNSHFTVPGSPTLYRLWGTSGRDVFAVGNAVAGSGTIYRFNGTSWNLMTSNTAQGLIGIWGSSGSDIYAGGFGGAMLRYNGASWGPMTSGTTGAIYTLWGTGSTGVWAAGFPGIMRLGTRGAPVASYGPTTYLGSTIAFSPNFLVGWSRTVSAKTVVTSLSVIAGGGVLPSNVNLALYTDNAGAPGTLLTQTGNFVVGALATYTRTVPQRTLQPGQYWIMQLYDQTLPIGYATSGGDGYAFLSGYTVAGGFPPSAPVMGTCCAPQNFNYYLTGFTVP